MPTKHWFGAVCLAVFATPVLGQGIVDQYVSGNELNIAVELGSALEADISVTFEQVDGLQAGALGVTVEQIDPSDALLLSRLPSGGLVSIPAAFPVKLSIAPPADGDLLFRGAAVVSFHTHNLTYTPASPLRLFKAEHGGPFVDITDNMSSGSYRVRGSQGEFSEFMIVTDLRPTAAVVLAKFDALEALLTQYQSSIDANVYAALTPLVSASRTAYLADSFAAAIKNLGDFTAQIKKSGGGEVPDVWRPRGDMNNVAGELRSSAGTLSFSLSLLANSL